MLTEEDLRSGLRELAASPPHGEGRFAAVERRARRNRRQSVVTGAALVAVLLAAVPAVLARRGSTDTAGRSAAFPTDVLVLRGDGIGVLPDISGTFASGSMPMHVRAQGQLTGGAVVGITGEALMRLDTGEQSYLGQADDWFPGLRPDEVWRVVGQNRACNGEPGCHTTYSIQRMGVDGMARGPVETLERDVRPLGVVPDGLVVAWTPVAVVDGARDHGLGDDWPRLALLDLETFEVRRTIDVRTSNAAVAGGVVVWQDCDAGEPCVLRMLDTGRGTTRSYPTEPDGELLRRGLSASGRWLVTSPAPGSQTLGVLDLRDGSTSALPGAVTDFVWSGDRLLFVSDGRVGGHVPTTDETRRSPEVNRSGNGGAPRWDQVYRVLGALDLGRD